jgi:hypothetical protein
MMNLKQCVVIAGKSRIACPAEYTFQFYGQAIRSEMNSGHKQQPQIDERLHPAVGNVYECLLSLTTQSAVTILDADEAPVVRHASVVDSIQTENQPTRHHNDVREPVVAVCDGQAD